MVNFLYSHKCFFRVAVLSLCFVLGFCMFPSADAYAVATEVALTYLIWGLFTAAGVTATSLSVVQNQTIDSDLRAGGNAGTRLVDMSNRFYTGLPAVDKNRLLRMAGELAISETRALLNTADNNADVKALAPAVDDFVSTEFGIYSLDDWADATSKSYSVDKGFYDGASVGLGSVYVTDGHINGVRIPTKYSSGYYDYPAGLSGNDGVFDVACSLYLGSSTSLRPYVQSVFNAGYSECVIHLWQSLGLDLQVHIKKAGSDGWAKIYFTYGDGSITISERNFIYWSNGSTFTITPWLSSDGNAHLTFRIGSSVNSLSSSNDFYWTSTTAVGRLFNFAYTTYQSGNPTYTVEGSGALALDEPVLLTELITFPTPPDSGDPDDDDHDIPLLWFPPWPSRQTAEDPPEEVPVVDPEQIVWNDLTVFNQEQLANGYPDQQPGSDPDGPGGGGGDIEFPSNGSLEIPASPPTSLGFGSIWHYVTDTFDYVADFFVLLGSILSAIPQPIMYLGWACIVLVIVFGIWRRFIE